MSKPKVVLHTVSARSINIGKPHCWNKHGRKGYMFLIGDEMAYSEVNRREVQTVIGDRLQQDLSPPKPLYGNCRNATMCFISCPREPVTAATPPSWDSGASSSAGTFSNWRIQKLSGETIALAIGMTEGTIDLKAGAMNLRDFGVADRTLQVVTTALMNIPAGLVKARVHGGILPGLLGK